MIQSRSRESGLDFPGTSGPFNAITDLPGVLVGMTTLIQGEGPLVQGKGPVRTGVTALLPRGFENQMLPVWAGVNSFNGNGEMTGTHWINDGGCFYGPILLTNTHSVGAAHHAAQRWMIRHFPAFQDTHRWALPVVAETYDGVLNDINGQHVTEQHVIDAIESATGGVVAQGNVGGGTGMICYEFKGGTGTASRKVGEHTVAALVQANHGIRDWFTVLGVPVGKALQEDRLLDQERGSIIVVIGTDAPMMPHQIQRLARRASIGIGKHGSPGGNNSGDIFLAFSTANAHATCPDRSGQRHFEFLADDDFDPYYLGAVQCVEEAVINAMLAAADMTTLRPAGLTCRALTPAMLNSVFPPHPNSE